MMVNEKEHVTNTNDDVLTDEDIHYLNVAIALALGSPDIDDMPKMKVALDSLYEKIERGNSNLTVRHILNIMDRHFQS